MKLAAIPGQEKAKQILQHALRSGRVSHAYLFAGPSGTGKLQAALAFAQALFCLSGGDDACGECLECRKFEHGNQPDLHRIVPDGQSVKLGQIQELQREMSYRTSDSGSRKVYVIEKADSMTLQAANSLLKFLEEPVRRRWRFCLRRIQVQFCRQSPRDRNQCHFSLTPPNKCWSS